jgi:hypothetical protein
MSSSIHAPGRRLSPHAEITASKAVSTRMWNRPQDRRRERETRSPSRGSTPRGSGDHQAIRPGSRGMGNSPAR